VPDEILVIVRPNTPPAALAAAERRFGLTLIASDRIDLIDSSIRRYRLPEGSTVPGAVQALSRDQRFAQAQPNYIFARPNYVYRLQSAVTTPSGGASLQYVADVLQLPQAHALAKGTRVPVAVIDSGIDSASPELAGRITKSYDAVGGAPAPHEHGTGMAGAIAATGQLVGVSPAADILAARAFGPPSPAAGASGTSFHILKALDWSAREGARIVNMSFAGPADPLLSQAIASASTRNIAFVAAMGNEGPSAPAAYPAADRHVIAVTATDQGGQIFAQANRGAHVAVAAPGVDVILPAPGGSYQVSSGTSVAAAHVSGIAALIIERAPTTTPDQLRRILTNTAQRGSTPQPALGAGVAAPVPALTAVAPAAPPAEATQQPKP
jgi:subtilisin family serine protease